MNAEEEQYASVALIGMSGRFPGADGIDEFWRDLVTGTPGIRTVTAEEIADAGVDPAVAADPGYVRVAAPLADIALFDASFFGFTPREAETTDPQHRLFLECVWEALESAGYRPDAMADRTGVFAGSGFTNYLLQNIHTRPDLMADLHKLQLAAGNDRDALSTMVSYKLGLRGPSVSVQSFCSTSLAAVHLAVQSLLTFESDVALAGGASIDLPQPAGYRFEEGGITSPDGVVRSFDARAAGTVIGNGVGVVVLKRTEDALRDGDHIYAVLRGSAMTNDGRAKVGYSAPGLDGQAAAIEDAIRVSGVDPRTIGYVECHATGTMLGDSVELSALDRAFRAVEADRESSGTDRPVTVLGSLKPTHGHLDRASGVSGLIRAALAIEHGLLPGTPNYGMPNPALVAAAGRFEVLASDRAWQSSGPRRAGVSSFGLGGTNVHVVLEQPPTAMPRPESSGPRLLALSARDLDALDEATGRLRDFLATRSDLDLADVAFTLQQSRTGFTVRRYMVCDDLADAVKALGDPSRWTTEAVVRRNPPVRLTRAAYSATPDRALAELRTALPLGDEAEDVADLLIAAGLPVVATGGELVAEATPGLVSSGTRWFWEQVGRLWLAGVDWDFMVLADGHRRRVALPTYPFRRSRHWVEPGVPRGEETPPAAAHGRNEALCDWFYQPVWRSRPLFEPAPVAALRELGPWLVFADDPLTERMASHLRTVGADVTIARTGTEFGGNGHDFTVRPGEPGDHDRLVDALAESAGTPPKTVVHGWSLGMPGELSARLSDRLTSFEMAQSRGFHAVRTTVGALNRRHAARSVRLVVLTGGAAAVNGVAPSHPEQATLSGLTPVISQECAEISCRQIDVEPTGSLSPEAISGLALDVVAEIAAASETVVAYRFGVRWTRDFEPLAVPPAADGVLSTVVPDGATVLITGGLGDVGLELARHLVRTRGARLLLTATTPLPDRVAWPDHVRRGDLGERRCRQLRLLLELEEAGAEIVTAAADTADVEAMARVVRTAESRFGRLDLVVHGAGVSDPSYFNESWALTPDQFDAHFRAKAHGFLVLQEALARAGQRPTGITLSSLAAVLGGLHFGAYAAANAALDAYAVQAWQSGQGRWLTVDWEAWRIRPEQHPGSGATITDFSMAPEEAVEVFDRALTLVGKVGHLVTSSGSLADRMTEWVVALSRDNTARADETAIAPMLLHARPPLSIPFEPPSEGPEHDVAEVWSEVLGIEPVGAHDDFFELGGHSLLATRLVAKLRSRLALVVSVLTVLEHPTVRLLTGAVLAEAGPAGPTVTEERKIP